MSYYEDLLRDAARWRRAEAFIRAELAEYETVGELEGIRNYIYDDIDPEDLLREVLAESRNGERN